MARVKDQSFYLRVLAAVVTDVRELASAVVSSTLNAALKDNAARAVREYLVGLMPSGPLAPKPRSCASIPLWDNQQP
ncbi:hypothetical protein [Mycobacterium alsense]|uniref:hypothetical protein n=1 Tax=Mycobacterium alsense TaxID=324058 RepID=UPI001041C767|nr:hypothetical protein [Mycobacterium alsense]